MPQPLGALLATLLANKNRFIAGFIHDYVLYFKKGEHYYSSPLGGIDVN
jgi:hypothetical protein